MRVQELTRALHAKKSPRGEPLARLFEVHVKSRGSWVTFYSSSTASLVRLESCASPFNILHGYGGSALLFLSQRFAVG